jgi:hypothetical protein
MFQSSAIHASLLPVLPEKDAEPRGQNAGEVAEGEKKHLGADAYLFTISKYA